MTAAKQQQAQGEFGTSESWPVVGAVAVARKLLTCAHAV